MASTYQIHACSLFLQTFVAGRECDLRRALLCNAAAGRGIAGRNSVVVRAANNKQKKKAKAKDKDKKKSASGDKQWKFDELMLVWDDVFLKICDDGHRATALYELSRSGYSQHGAGCVLMEETVTTRPWGAASGFTFKSRYSSTASPELPSYHCAQWTATYVPREFILDPTKALASSSSSSSDLPAAAQMMEDGSAEAEVPLVEQGKLLSVLRGMDKTRLLGLLSEPGSQEKVDAGARDVGGEAPCDMAADELVVMLLASVDGQPAVGADVLKAFRTGVQQGGNAGPSWSLKMRDDLPP